MTHIISLNLQNVSPVINNYIFLGVQYCCPASFIFKMASIW